MVGQSLERSQATIGTELSSSSTVGSVWTADFLVASSTAIATPCQYSSMGISGGIASSTASTDGLADLQTLSR